MEKSQATNPIYQALKEFEEMEDIQVSANWQEGLLNRVRASKQTNPSGVHFNKITMVMVVIIAVNASFVLNSVFGNFQSTKRDVEWQVISDELFTNRVSQNP
jgi:oligoribonuclease (3'-5' exoribonuclease)